MCIRDRGIRENGHLHYLGAEFARHGLPLHRNLVVRDDPAEIEAAFRQAWAEADVVITTGGLGPTSDDNTREAVARVLGLPLEFDATVEAAIQERFARMNRRLTDNDRKQCYRPVSYTHLDVYKRQVDCRCFGPGAGGIARWSRGRG